MADATHSMWKAFCCLFQAAMVVPSEQCWLFLSTLDTSSVTPVFLCILITSFQFFSFGVIFLFYVKSFIVRCVHQSKDRWHLDNSVLWPVFSPADLWLSRRPDLTGRNTIIISCLVSWPMECDIIGRLQVSEVSQSWLSVSEQSLWVTGQIKATLLTWM